MVKPPKALHVAVVEDDPRIQQLISAEITDEGHACICFGSAEDFLVEAISERFDLLLLDLMLPGMDGLATDAQPCRDRAPVRQASSKRLRSMGTTEPPPRSSLRSWDVITRCRTSPSRD
jgi:CheY-like chemotaxis protein